MAPLDVTGIVLAGGRSSRFGGPKLEARLDGRTLLELAVRAVSAVSSEIVVAAGGSPTTAGESPPANAALSGIAADVEVRVVQDPAPFGGPLVGLLSALEAASGPVAIVVGGDMPRLRPAVLRALLDGLVEPISDAGPGRRTTIDAAVLGVGGAFAPLPVAIRVSAAIEAARSTLGSGDRSLRAMLGRLGPHVIPKAAWRPLDIDGETLIDVDVRADLERLI
jgi:molybdopterin-guanine dinucleotide biosynthesis protein A